ncbi:MAG: hypothetical protein RLZZ176_463 [Cyanobacteriota bacterium]
MAFIFCGCYLRFIVWPVSQAVTILCKFLFITTPEQHWLHHQKTNLGFGDIFTFFDQPAKVWMRWLRLMRIRWCLYLENKVSG